MCCIITGVRGSQSTLGNTLKKLETKGVVIHTAMKEGFKSCMDIRQMQMEFVMVE